MSKTSTGGVGHAKTAGAPAGRPTTASTTPGNRRVLVVFAVLAALVVVGGVASLFWRDGQGEVTGATGATARLEHVHGLGIDTADGTLYVGTHYGLFRLPEQGAATRVADLVQDFMGFTVVGPNHYLASGHPGEFQDGPPSLGLIESTDGGLSWRSLSLAGEADFHAIEARHGLVYGLNSLTGQFMVSADKKSWETRSQIPMADFAVSPEDPDVVLATTEQGLVRSVDGGRTFLSVPAAPLLQLVSWAMDGTIIGVQPDGTLQASIDEGETWEQRGSLNEAPHAVSASSGSEVFAAVAGKILASDDGGRTFSIRYRE